MHGETFFYSSWTPAEGGGASRSRQVSWWSCARWTNPIREGMSRLWRGEKPVRSGGMSEFSGHLHLRGHSARRAAGRAWSEQSFRAPFHLSKPYWDADAKTLLVQIVNPTAGILSGDRLESRITVDAGASLLVTTPSASRVFQMKDGTAECRQQFAVASGAWLEVMPEPLVPHRGSRYRQFTSVNVETGGALFFVDQLMPGRVAHGEAWTWDRLCLELEVKLDGKLILRERLDQRGEDLRCLAELAGSGPAACFANAVLISQTGTDEPSLAQRDCGASQRRPMGRRECAGAGRLDHQADRERTTCVCEQRFAPMRKILTRVHFRSWPVTRANFELQSAD